MALGAITITAEREQVIDFSKPFMDFKISMMLEKPKGEDVDLFAFMLPFHRDVWISTVGVVSIDRSYFTHDYNFNYEDDSDDENDDEDIKKSQLPYSYIINKRILMIS